ncbi:hypothetical protein PM082_005932 [Marasmius tenuissimus]|nr:hypothetical protein PM082_005932 [Marasmius tenuissimus]
MGNSPSSSRKNSISNPRALSRDGSTRHRKGDFLNASHSGHRRSRSANAAYSRRNLDPDVVQNPPPPYSRTPPAYLEDLKYGSKPFKGSRSSISLSPSSSSVESEKKRQSSSYLRQPVRQKTMDDVLRTLKKYDIVIVVDDSSSMIGPRWKEARKALAELASQARRFDTDGIDIYFLNDEREGLRMTDENAVYALFDQVEPRGVTPIGERLESLLQPYLRELEAAGNTAQALKEIKPVNYLIITDGAPTDDPESVIAHAARRLDEKHFPLSQVGIQFVQIGRSSSAARYLRDLDDQLAFRHNLKRDIVDTTRYIGQNLNADALVKILLGGINRRVDNEGAGVFHEDVDLSPTTPIVRLEGTF